MGNSINIENGIPKYSYGLNVTSIKNSVILLASYNCLENIDKLKNVRKLQNSFIVIILCRI